MSNPTGTVEPMSVLHGRNGNAWRAPIHWIPITSMILSPDRSDFVGQALQDRLLPGVSRTFALTIPQLPSALRPVVANAYLLCRTADTIEDEVALTVDQKQHFHDQFVCVVEGRQDPHVFAVALASLLSDATLPAEQELIRETPAVVQVTRACPPRQRAAIERCIRIMCAGMPPFQRTTGLSGLADQSELDRYCYCVAGVVGEMLTDLFCAYSADIDERRTTLAPLATSFGQGLQMTNIIKDFWTDRQRGVCWFPRDIFARVGLDLRTVTPGHDQAKLAAGLEELIGVAHAHLRNALTYTLAIPRRQTGIRRFCLWAIGLAVLTLRKIHHNPAFLSGEAVKVSRRTVRATVLATSLAVRGDWVLTQMFQQSAGPLPLGPVRGAPYVAWAATP
jgi:farnesyl-diphosphate farnesyltransferase